MRPDPERARLAAEALARARADAWARGERPLGGLGAAGGAGSTPLRAGSGGYAGVDNSATRGGAGGSGGVDSPATRGGSGGYGGADSPSLRGGIPGGRPPGTTQRPRRDDPQSLTAALGGLLSARGWRQRAAVGAVFGEWPQIVGPQLAIHTKPESFDNGELVVSADSHAWAAQVTLMAPQLIKRMAEEVGHGVVRRIRVRGPAGPPRQTGRLRVR